MTTPTPTTGNEWTTYAKDWLYEYLTTHETIFGEDLWSEGLEQPPRPHDGRLLGPVLTYAQKEEWLVQSGDFRQACADSGSAYRPVYTSRLFVGSDSTLAVGS